MAINPEFNFDKSNETFGSLANLTGIVTAVNTEIETNLLKESSLGTDFQWSAGYVDVIGCIPIGGVISWLKSFTGTPALTAEYVECNGQVLSDAESVYNGLTIPNLNGSGATTKRFLRGSITSGTTGGTETHTHTIPPTTVATATCGGQGFTVGGQGHLHAAGCGCSGFTGASGTLPSYYEVVFVMRIK